MCILIFLGYLESSFDPSWFYLKATED
jgi:hypothetical protein